MMKYKNKDVYVLLKSLDVHRIADVLDVNESVK
jgi:hypothetical protein